jgi:hypothetical protein
MGTVVFFYLQPTSAFYYIITKVQSTQHEANKNHILCPFRSVGVLLNSCCHIIRSHESTNPAHVRKSNRADEFKRFSSRVGGC